MNRTSAAPSRIVAVLLAALFVLDAAHAQRAAPPSYPIQHLTAPSNADPLEVYRTYLQRNRAAMGLSAADVDSAVVRDRHVSRRSGTTHLYMRQQLDGIDVIGTETTVSVTRDGRLLRHGDRMIRALESRVEARRPALSAEAALRLWADDEGLSVPSTLVVMRDVGGPAEEVVFAPSGLSRDEIRAKLAYVARDDGQVRLSWNFVVRTMDGRHWWNLFVDAENGAQMRVEDWIKRERYNVHPAPQENPDDGPRSQVADPADPLASPFGWFDTNGVAGAEFTDTRGNNVSAQEDAEANDAGGSRPDGGAAAVFDFPLDLTTHPSGYQDAAITNLFFWNNFIHDVLYRYGFDEAAGNFQQNNYGRGGAGNDAVQADAQDGADEGNAQFGTPPDGFTPRMEMFLFVGGIGPALRVLAPASAAGFYAASGGAFGGQIAGLRGDVVLALDPADGAGPGTTDACSPLSNPSAVAGNIALVDRGECFFIDKTANVQAAGGIGIIIVNNAGNALVSMSGDGRGLSIPPLFIGQSDGAALKAQLANGLRVELSTASTRDSALDNGIIVHEYTHGLTNRLTGGAGNAGCLGSIQSGGLGEGWSDWFALMFTAKLADSPLAARTIGSYVLNEPPGGAGFRNHPYSRDLGISPLTLAEIDKLNRPHGIGEVWAAALWDLTWGFVDQYGFDADLHSGTGGNNILLQLVVDALKLQPCEPSFVEARDAVLAADLNDSGGANTCLIWDSFARRGLGASAEANSANSVSVSEAFDLPQQCSSQCGNGTVAPGEQCDDGNTASFDGCAANCRLETILPALSGVSAGGSLSITVAGVTVLAPTVAGQSAQAAAAAIAAAVNGSSALQALEVSATAADGLTSLSGVVNEFALNDGGLAAGGGQRQSLAGITTVRSGLNAFGAPLDSANTLEDSLRALETPAAARSIAVLRASTILRCELDQAGTAQGSGCALPVNAGDAWLLTAGNDYEVVYDEAFTCPSYTLARGTHLVSFPCARDGLTASALLSALEPPSSVEALQDFDTRSGRWRSATRAGTTRTDFDVRADRGYLLSLSGDIVLRAPQARVGFDRGVRIATPVTLDGSTSADADGDQLSFQWRLAEAPPGSSAALSDASAAKPTLSPDAVGTYRAELTVSDGIFKSAPVEIVIWAFDPQLSPATAQVLSAPMAPPAR